MVLTTPRNDWKAYAIDADNRLCDIRGNWDDFAGSNDGQRAGRKSVMGLRMSAFVTGLDTQAFLNAVFFLCRTEGCQFATTYRCDSPLEQRTYRMTVQPDGDLLWVHHNLIQLSPARRAARYDLPRTGPVTCCSMCGSVRVQSRWVESTALPLDAQKHKVYRLCPSCREKVSIALDSIRQPCALADA